MLHARAMKPASLARCAEMVLMRAGQNDCQLICQRTQCEFTKNSGEQWRIYIEFTMDFAILWASESGLQTVAICGLKNIFLEKRSQTLPVIIKDLKNTKPNQTQIEPKKPAFNPLKTHLNPNNDPPKPNRTQKS
jgi:hypothetical protein